MSSRQNMFRDPDKRAAKRRAQREAKSRGSHPTTKKNLPMSQSQVNHASGSAARKKQREGERKMESEQ